MTPPIDMTLVAVDVQGLTGAALDWATLIAMGVQPTVKLGGTYGAPNTKPYVEAYGNPHSLSTDWRIGGALLDEFRISFATQGTGPADESGKEPILAIPERLHYRIGSGNTHLVAACRAVVATVCGDNVTVPACLVLP